MAGEQLFDTVFDGVRRSARPSRGGVEPAFGFDAPVFIIAHSDITMSALVAKSGVYQVALTFSYTDTNTNPLWQIAAVEIWISKVNDRTQASEFAQADSPFTSFTHLIPSHEGVRYYWIRARDGAGNVGPWFPTSDTAGVQAAPDAVPQIAGLNLNLGNGKLVASVAANALTVAVKTINGDDPGASNPVFVQFRKSDGSFQSAAITAAMSQTIAAGTTLNAVSAKALRLWATIINADGVLSLALFNALSRSTNSIVALPEVSSGAAFYPALTAGDGYTNVASLYRVVGFLEWTSGLATAGQWSVVPDVISGFRDGMKRPGEIIQSNVNSYVTAATGTTQIPFDDTPPQDTEGEMVGGVVVFPQSKANVIETDFVIPCSYSAIGVLTAAVFDPDDGTADAVYAAWEKISAADDPVTIRGLFRRTADQGTITHSVNLGGSVAGTFTFVGSGGSRKLGGSAAAVIRASEIQG
jgi:hypothetical protein